MLRSGLVDASHRAIGTGRDIANAACRLQMAISDETANGIVETLIQEYSGKPWTKWMYLSFYHCHKMQTLNDHI